MNIEIYTRGGCSYCELAKGLLNQSGIKFTEYKLNEDFTREVLLEKFPEARTFPVVVIDGFRIGGYTELKQHLDESSQNPSMKILMEQITL